jgi:hypothetical protein
MIHQSDVFIREAILLGLEDIRKNIWLLDDILGDFTNNQYLTAKYAKQVEAAKEWFLNNNVDVVMGMRNDMDRLPQVSITLGSSSERSEMKTLADSSVETVKLLPNGIGKPIPYVVKPFRILSYDISTGEVICDPATNLSGISEAGMILVNPTTGEGYQIQSLTPDGIGLLPGLQVPITSYGVVPQFQYYEARIEHTFFSESYSIECTASGDPQVLLWLHSIVLYSILRYRESLLEANGFSESTVSSSDIQVNSAYGSGGGERAFSRMITLNGMTESSWIKTPRRFVESMILAENTPEGLTGGIKILSNAHTPQSIDITKESWRTVDDTDEEYDDDSYT